MSRDESAIPRRSAFTYLSVDDLQRLARIVRGDDPWKVKRVRLLQSLGLPLDDTFVFSVEELSRSEATMVEQAKRLLNRFATVVIRTAWQPARVGAPWFIAHDIQQVLDALAAIRNLSVSEYRLSHVLLHSDLADPTIMDDKERYIAGRVLLHTAGEIPAGWTLEVVQGEYYAEIFDYGGFDPRCERYARYTKGVAQVAWRCLKRSRKIRDADVRRVLSRLAECREGIEALSEVLAFSAGTQPGNLCVIVEFVSSAGSDRAFVTYDFDFAVAK